jgi:hypothetical protein
MAFSGPTSQFTFSNNVTLNPPGVITVSGTGVNQFNGKLFIGNAGAQAGFSGGVNTTTGGALFILKTTAAGNYSDLRWDSNLGIMGNIVGTDATSNIGSPYRNSTWQVMGLKGDMWVENTDATGNLLFGTGSSGTERLRIFNNGDVFVGGNSPTDIPSSVFTLGSTTQGAIMAPIMTRTQFAAISSPATSLHAILSDSSGRLALWTGSKIVTYATTDQLGSIVPTLQQVLTSGSVLTASGSNSIDINSGTLNFLGESAASVFLGTSGSKLNGVIINSLGALQFTGGQYNNVKGSQFLIQAATVNNPITAASGTVTDYASVDLESATVSSTNTGVTYTNASTLYISAAPSAGTNSTITNQFAIRVINGNSFFGGGINLNASQFLLNGNRNWNPGSAIPGSIFSIAPVTLTDNVTAASGTVSNAYVFGISTPTLAATNSSVTTTNAFTFYVNASPAAGTNNTITNSYAAGFGGDVLFQGAARVGQFITTFVNKTANYTVQAGDYTINCTANTFNVTLLSAVGITGQIFIIKNRGGGTITVNTTSSQTIDGSATQTLTTNQSIQVQSDGANWVIE